MSASQSSPQPAPGRFPRPRPVDATSPASDPATLRGGAEKTEPRVPKKSIPPPGYDPARDSMDVAGQAYELFLHIDTLRRQINGGIHPPFSINADGSYLFSRKATAAWLEQRRCRNLLEAAEVRREDAKVRRSRRKEANRDG